MEQFATEYYLSILVPIAIAVYLLMTVPETIKTNKKKNEENQARKIIREAIIAYLQDGPKHQLKAEKYAREQVDRKHGSLAGVVMRDMYMEYEVDLNDGMASLREER